MSWNHPTGPVKPVKKRPPPSMLKGIAAGLLVVAALAAVLYVVLGVGRSPSASQPVGGDPRAPRTIKAVTPAPAPTNETGRVSRIKAELNDVVKEFIKKPLTNKTQIVGRKLDPDDPDNIFRTQFARDVDILLRIKPGERIPKQLVFGFMFEDAGIKMARASGQKIIENDGGNGVFLDAIKKWKVAVKDSDDQYQVGKKQRLVDAQIDLLRGIDEGISVNDSIRAAYEFRVRAAEARKEMVDMITELHGKEGSTVEDTVALIKHANEKLTADGIKEIYPDEIIEDYEAPNAKEDGDEK